MANSIHSTLHKLREIGYFSDPDIGALEDMAYQFGVEAALFTPLSGRAVLLDAEDMADGGAGMAIQQIRMLLATRGVVVTAADAEHYDEASGTTSLDVNGMRCTLMDWSFSKRPPPDDIAAASCPPSLRDLLWKGRVQGYEMQILPCVHGSAGVDLHLRLGQDTRFLAHWAPGFDDGRVLYSVNFFTIANCLLERLGLEDRLHAWQPFTSGQTGVMLNAAWYERLQNLELTRQLRRIDGAQ